VEYASFHASSLQPIRSARVDEEALLAKSERADRVVPEAQYLERHGGQVGEEETSPIGELGEIVTPGRVIARQREDRLEERLLRRLDPDPRGHSIQKRPVGLSRSCGGDI
jgi:hypothetical protein